MSMKLLQDQIESLVDQYGARAVAEHLVEVFHDKAEHIDHAWQDRPLARKWMRAATRLGNAVHWQGSDLDWPS